MHQVAQCGEQKKDDFTDITKMGTYRQKTYLLNAKVGCSKEARHCRKYENDCRKISKLDLAGEEFHSLEIETIDKNWRRWHTLQTLLLSVTLEVRYPPELVPTDKRLNNEEFHFIRTDYNKVNPTRPEIHFAFENFCLVCNAVKRKQAGARISNYQF